MAGLLDVRHQNHGVRYTVTQRENIYLRNIIYSYNERNWCTNWVVCHCTRISRDIRPAVALQTSTSDLSYEGITIKWQWCGSLSARWYLVHHYRPFCYGCDMSVLILGVDRSGERFEHRLASPVRSEDSNDCATLYVQGHVVRRYDRGLPWVYTFRSPSTTSTRLIPKIIHGSSVVFNDLDGSLHAVGLHLLSRLDTLGGFGHYHHGRQSVFTRDKSPRHRRIRAL